MSKQSQPSAPQLPRCLLGAHSMMRDSRRPEEGRTEAVESGLLILSQAALPFLFGSGRLPRFESPEDRVLLLLAERTRYRNRS